MTEYEPYARAPYRQALYLGHEILSLVCPAALSRYPARFEFLSRYFAERKLDAGLGVREPEPGYADLYFTLWQGRPSGKFIPLIVDALFHEFFALHRRDNPLESHEAFCERELGRFIKRYFPDLELSGLGFERLVATCRRLGREAASIMAAGVHPTPRAAELKKIDALLTSRNPAFNELIRMLNKAAYSCAPILLTGESGTGKEVFARFVHARSPRVAGPFQPLNCAAMPEQLLESELFGHLKGAFTGADRDKPGLIASAEGGTLFLDEIAETPPSFQVKLLRFLQEGTILPVGGRRERRVDVRVVAATNQDLEQALAEGRLRRDLYYRLNVFHAHLPSLKDRPEDIPELARHFAARHAPGGAELEEAALLSLAAHDWPGNVRELENVIQRALILSGGSVIRPEHLPPNLGSKLRSRAGVAAPGPRALVDEAALAQALGKALKKAGPGRGEAKRLAMSVPLGHMVDFFARQGFEPFPPRLFADHISPPHWLHRRDKLAHLVLAALRKEGVVEHNGRKAQAARYALAPGLLRPG